jgi:RNA polymerase sigma factor (sigma-70 family)
MLTGDLSPAPAPLDDVAIALRIRAFIADGTPEAGTEAMAFRAAMIEAHLGLVHHIARRYASTMDYEDRVMYGVMGLIRAVDGFDPEVGERFSVYAANWIRARIRRALSDYSRMVRLPAYVVEGYQALVRAMADGEIDEGDVEALAAATRFKADKVRVLLSSYTERVVALVTEVGVDGDDHVHVAVCPRATPAQLVAREERRVAVAAAMQRLTEREQFVLMRRYGFIDDRGDHGLPARDGYWYLDEVAAALGLSVGTVRKVQADALRKMRRRLLEHGDEG